MKYNVLVYGSGAREHALCDKISQSSLLGKLFLALPNDGFKNLGEEIFFSNFKDLAQKCVEIGIDLVVIGPELPLAQGIVDILQANGIKCIGASKFWAQLESSKKFAKEFMDKYGIKTAKYCVFTPHPSPLPQGERELITNFSTPPVIKADGLAAGKGVYISESFEDAKNCIDDFLNGKFGDASKTVIVEEKLEGEEISLIALYDGQTLLPFIPARDYKKLLDNNKGPNTGGMGSFCPVDLTAEQNIQLAEYIEQLESALIAEKADFCGVIYSGLILTKDGIKVLEFNMRFGDPETQSLLTHLDFDLLEIFIKMTEEKLSDVDLKWKKGTSICVVLACEGYPENPKVDDLISYPSPNFSDTRCLHQKIPSPSRGEGDRNCKIYFAGVKKEDEKLLTASGRVISVCANAKTIESARQKAYQAAKEIKFENKIFRTDIGL